MPTQQTKLGTMGGTVQTGWHRGTHATVHGTKDSETGDKHRGEGKGDHPSQTNGTVRQEAPLATSKAGYPYTRANDRQDTQEGGIGTEVPNQEGAVQVPAC